MRDFLHNILHDKPLRVLANDGCGSVSFAKKGLSKTLRNTPQCDLMAQDSRL
jgi:hypothetical protein